MTALDPRSSCARFRLCVAANRSHRSLPLQNAYHDWKTWEEAEQRCVDEGGHLASIHGPYEEQFIAAAILELAGTGLVQQNWWSDSVWIGLTNKRDTVAYEWVDSTILDYVYWASGFPLVDAVATAQYYPDALDPSLGYIGQAHQWTLCYLKDNCRVRASVCKKDMGS